MTNEELEKLAIQKYYAREKNWQEQEKTRRKQHLDSAFADLKDKLPGLVMDEENDCFHFCGRKGRAIIKGSYYNGGGPAYCLEFGPGEYISSLESFGEFLVRKK